MTLDRIAATSYLNTIPFIYGIENAYAKCSEILLSTPNKCAEAFFSKQADIALVPVGAFSSLDDLQIITPYCLGASSAVRTVVIVSNQPIEQISNLYLDSHSLTSVKLARILCRELWNIQPQFHHLDQYDKLDDAKKGEGFLLIGDKVFENESRFSFSYDLAQGWRELTSLPFVFAVWIAREGVIPQVIEELSKALCYGVEHIPEAIRQYDHSSKDYALDYLTHNIDFILDDQKRTALNLFWEKGRKVDPPSQPG